MESLQSFLPVRVPSSVDWLCNSVGGAAGGVLAVVLERRGWLYHWAQFRRNWLTPDASTSLVLMALWPLALLFPVSVPLGLGQVLERLSGTWLHKLPLEGMFQTLSPGMEMLCVALGLMVPALLGLSVVRNLSQRLKVVLVVVWMAVLANGLSAALTYGPERTWYWLNPQVFDGMALGCLFSLLAIKLSSRWTLGLMLLAQLLLLIGVNLLHTSTYFAQTVQTWEQGRFIRFHGLTQWLNWLWPWAVLVWGVVRLWMPTASPKSQT
jgi:hypothetical protein